MIEKQIDKNKYFKENSSEKYLEIGPLDRPFLTKDKYDVYYLDYRTTEEIKEVYEDTYANLANIVEIDFPTQGRTYEESVKGMKFDAVYSSHCAEHTFDIIGHFQDVSNILNENGFYYMIIPDKTGWFDYFRRPTTFWDAYNAYKDNGINMNIADSWINTKPYYEGEDIRLFNNKTISFIPNLIDEEWRIKDAQSLINGGKVHTSEKSPHIWTFTTKSVLELVRDCLRFNLIDFTIEGFEKSTKNDISIKLILRKNPLLLTDSEQRLTEIVKIQLMIEFISGESGKAIIDAFQRKKVYLYGHGFVGKKMGTCFKNIFGKDVTYIVSDDKVIEESVVPLSLVNPNDKDIMIILSSSDRKMVVEMKDNLESKGFVEGKNYIIL